MPAPKITFYVDIVSPFAYIAYYTLRHSPVFRPCEITYVPVFLGGVMKSTGNRPPLEIKNKDKWIEIERKRWASLFSIPIAESAPDGFPVLTLTTQRVLTAVTTQAPGKLIPALDALFEGFWVKRNEDFVNKPEGIMKALSPILGKDLAEKVLAEANSDQAKKLLNQRSQEAVDEGAFGLPYFVGAYHLSHSCASLGLFLVTPSNWTLMAEYAATNREGQKECFWGFDHIGQVVMHLGLEREKLPGWKAML
ncbi:MAG: hypothetical protein M1828_006732 [Chrysothrix sp. TS-e1954]|nr:MAG: hypothetical protein M1828_006732 [Chrysothrix sp. TS-e1954]